LFSTLNRRHLALVHKEVREAGISTPMKDTCVFKTSDGWEFYGPNEFRWRGRAEDAYDARVKGWVEWLKKFGSYQTKLNLKG